MRPSRDLYDTIRDRIMTELGDGHIWAVDFVGKLDSVRVGVWLFVESEQDSELLTANAGFLDELRRVVKDEAPGVTVEAVNVCSRERLERDFQGSRFYATR